MTPQISDEVLENFRIGEDDFRDLDSILRRHCETVKYYVHKGSTLGDYDTDNVEGLLRDRNGAETRIKSVLVKTTGIEGLRFDIEFNGEVVMNGECKDRARLVLLATDVRSVMRDRMKGGIPKRKTILQAIAVIAFIAGYLGFQHIQDSYVNRFNAAQTAQMSRNSTTVALKSTNADILLNQGLLSQAETALSRHNLNAEVDFLVQQQIGQLRQRIASDQETLAATRSSDVPSSPDAPLWSTSWWLLLVVACATAAIAAGMGHLVLPTDRSVFLIGDEKRRQDRADNRRTQIRWTIGGGFVVSIVSGLLLTLH